MRPSHAVGRCIGNRLLQCPLLSAKRTSQIEAAMSAYDPQQTLGPDRRMLSEWQTLVPRVRLFLRRAQTGHLSFMKPFGSNG